jgi:hypothetical protein
MKNEVITEINEKFDDVSKYIINKAIQCSFKLNDLPDVNNYHTNILIQDGFSHIFNILNTIQKNCIYWFELENQEDCALLVERLNKNRTQLKENKRVVPPQNTNRCSNILYLGIRRGGFRKKDGLTKISSRIVHHLGYYYKGETQGLQLVHWCRGLDITIKLNFVELDGLPNDYLNVAEKILSYHLKPLCGKH